jgi:hypothetical protein
MDNFRFFDFLISHTMPTMAALAALAALAAIPNHLYVPNLCQFYQLKISFFSFNFFPQKLPVTKLDGGIKNKTFSALSKTSSYFFFGSLSSINIAV